jgi:putative solute:sodium symporter small subunit
MNQDRAKAYWRANLKLVAVLLCIWFVVSFGFGILLVEPLNRIDFFGFKLGFWWAQQGAIYVFIVLIFVYAAGMRRLDRKYDVNEREE